MLCFEFVKLYLFKFCLDESNETKKHELELEISNYMDRTNKIQKFLNSQKKNKTNMQVLSLNNNECFPTLGKNLY